MNRRLVGALVENLPDDSRQLLSATALFDLRESYKAYRRAVLSIIDPR
jgi:hypothetical protein